MTNLDIMRKSLIEQDLNLKTVMDYRMPPLIVADDVSVHVQMIA